jgi:O-antigen/teichoic acid export membrane protein
VSLSERIAEGLKASFVAQLVYAVGTGALTLILARYLLDPEGYGLLYFALSVLGVTQLVATLGLPKSGAKYVNEYVEKDASQVRFVLRRTLGYTLAVTTVVCAGLVVFAPPAARYFDRSAVIPFLLVGAGYVALAALDVYLRLSFQALNQLAYAAVVRSVNAVARLVFAVSFVLLGYGALGALFGYIAGFALAIVVGLWLLYSRFYTQYAEAEEPEPGLSRRIVRYSLPLTVMQGAELLDSKVDAVLVGLLMNPVAVGYYVLSKQIVDFSAVPAVAMGATVSPALGSEKAGDRSDRAARLYEQSLVHMLLLYIPAAVGLFLVAEPTIRYVFGSGYMDAVPVLQILSGWLVITSVTRVTSNALDYLGLAGARARVRGVTAVGNFVLNLLLIPPMGVAGAALATVLTSGTYAVTAVYFIHRELGLDLGYVARKGALVCAVGVAMGVGVSAALPHVSGPITLAAVVGVGVAIWGTTATASGVLDLKRIVAFLS